MPACNGHRSIFITPKTTIEHISIYARLRICKFYAISYLQFIKTELEIHMTKFKTIALLGFVALGLSTLMSSPAQAADPCEDKLATTWVGCEYGNYCEWKFTFKRRGCSSTWDATWTHARHPMIKGVLYITPSNTGVTIRRPSAGGVSCTYTGTFKNPILVYRNVVGTYKCSNGYVGPWKATRALG